MFDFKQKEKDRKDKIVSCTIITILSMIMGLMLAYLSAIEPSSFGKDFMAFYSVVFLLIAVFFTILNAIGHYSLYKTQQEWKKQ